MKSGAPSITAQLSYRDHGTWSERSELESEADAPQESTLKRAEPKRSKKFIKPCKSDFLKSSQLSK